MIANHFKNERKNKQNERTKQRNLLFALEVLVRTFKFLNRRKRPIYIIYDVCNTGCRQRVIEQMPVRVTFMIINLKVIFSKEKIFEKK